MREELRHAWDRTKRPGTVELIGAVVSGLVAAVADQGVAFRGWHALGVGIAAGASLWVLRFVGHLWTAPGEIAVDDRKDLEGAYERLTHRVQIAKTPPIVDGVLPEVAKVLAATTEDYRTRLAASEEARAEEQKYLQHAAEMLDVANAKARILEDALRRQEDSTDRWKMLSEAATKLFADYKTLATDAQSENADGAEALRKAEGHLVSPRAATVVSRGRTGFSQTVELTPAVATAVANPVTLDGPPLDGQPVVTLPSLRASGGVQTTALEAALSIGFTTTGDLTVVTLQERVQDLEERIAGALEEIARMRHRRLAPEMGAFVLKGGFTAPIRPSPSASSTEAHPPEGDAS